MKTEEEIREKLQSIQEYINTVPKKRLLLEDERTSFAGSNGAVEVLKWVLDIRELGDKWII